MQQPDDGEPHHAAIENGKAVAAATLHVAKDDRETDTEEYREYCVELAVDQQILDPFGDAVDACRRHGVDNLARLKRQQPYPCAKTVT